MTDAPDSKTVRLTEYSHGAGCGCKISPAVLKQILGGLKSDSSFPGLLVGNAESDDAAVYDLDGKTAIVSTTDFFMPIVDDPYDFGRIAATNAISDIYAMGGTPIMAIAILGWPIEQLSAEVAQRVVDGGRQTCLDANITLAGGHSIDSPEPFFGLAVTGRVLHAHLKRNDTATPDSILLLSKALGVGALTTGEKRGELKDEFTHVARDSMCQLNSIGSELAKISGVNAMTDVTGFGLLGHLHELGLGSSVGATVRLQDVPLLPGAADLMRGNCIPGGTTRNYASYRSSVRALSDYEQAVLCDPQTSGGLLIATRLDALDSVIACAEQHGVVLSNIGKLSTRTDTSQDSLINII